LEAKFNLWDQRRVLLPSTRIAAVVAMHAVDIDHIDILRDLPLPQRECENVSSRVLEFGTYPSRLHQRKEN
jgi:hypothetical protein